jgi:hypothetical protein
MIKKSLKIPKGHSEALNKLYVRTIATQRVLQVTIPDAGYSP